MSSKDEGRQLELGRHLAKLSVIKQTEVRFTSNPLVVIAWHTPTGFQILIGHDRFAIGAFATRAFRISFSALVMLGVSLNHTMLQGMGRLHKNVQEASVLHDCPFEDVGNCRGLWQIVAVQAQVQRSQASMFQSIAHFQAE